MLDVNLETGETHWPNSRYGFFLRRVSWRQQEQPGKHHRLAP